MLLELEDSASLIIDDKNTWFKHGSLKDYLGMNNSDDYSSVSEFAQRFSFLFRFLEIIIARYRFFRAIVQMLPRARLRMIPTNIATNICRTHRPRVNRAPHQLFVRPEE